MGHDLEKFDVSLGTYAHCYTNGWLENFFTSIDSCSDWLALSTPEAAVAACSPLGRADLPAASYTEMMEWVLPTSARNLYQRLLEEFSGRPDPDQPDRDDFRV